MSLSLKNPNYELRIDCGEFALRPVTLEDLKNPNYSSWLKNKEMIKYLKFNENTISLEYLINYINANRKKGFENFAVLHRGEFCGTINYNYKNQQSNSAAYGIMIGSNKARSYGAGIYATAMMIYFFVKILRVKHIGPETTHKDNKNAISILKYFNFIPEKNEVEWGNYHLKNVSSSIISKFEKNFKKKIYHECIKSI